MLDNGYANGLSAADVGAVVGNHYNNGFGGADGLWWLIVIVIIAFMGNGGFGFGNGGGLMTGLNLATQSEVQRGFDQSALTANLSSLQTGQTNAMQNLSNQINTIAMSQQNSDCQTRSEIADLKYTLAIEACQDRQAISDAVKDLTATVISQNQGIKDQLFQDKMDAKDEVIANLRTQLNMSALRESQNAQTAALLADNAAQTTNIEQYLNPTPRPAYLVANPNCCGSGFNNFYNGTALV